MSAGSAQEQIPTRTRSAGLEDLFVDAGWDDAVDVDRLRDVLEGLLPDALEDEVMTDALGRREPAGRHLVLVDQGIRLAPDRDDRRGAEAKDEHDHDEQPDLDREPGAEHRRAVSAARPARSPVRARPPLSDRAA